MFRVFFIVLGFLTCFYHQLYSYFCRLVLFLVVVKSFTCLVFCVCLSPSLPVNTGSLSLAWL